MPVLKARIGGAWVDVGGGGVDEVWVGPAAPVDAATELWYDTDEVGGGDRMPRGFIGSDRTSTSVSVGTAATEIGARVTWTADSTRRYKTTIYCGRVDGGSTKVNVALRLTNAAGGGGTLEERAWSLVAGDSVVPHLIFLESGLSGTVTRNAMIYATATGCTIYNGTTVLVEDIGGV